MHHCHTTSVTGGTCRCTTVTPLVSLEARAGSVTGPLGTVVYLQGPLGIVVYLHGPLGTAVHLHGLHWCTVKKKQRVFGYTPIKVCHR